MKKLLYIIFLLPFLVFGQTDSSFITPVTDQNFVVPAGVTAISVVAIQGGDGSAGSAGSGGRGGDLRFVNLLVVTPGETLKITVGTAGAASFGATNNPGGHSYIKRGMTLIFSSDGTGSDGGGIGGLGGEPFIIGSPYGDVKNGGKGGGTSGYSDDGGSESGGSAGNGAYSNGTWLYNAEFDFYYGRDGSGGGGTGLGGEGSSGSNAIVAENPNGGGGGSGGTNGNGIAGNYGGGGGGGYSRILSGGLPGTAHKGFASSDGALRITYTTGIVPEQKPIPPTWHSNTAMAMMMGIIANFSQPVDLLTGLVSVWEMDRTTVGGAIEVTQDGTGGWTFDLVGYTINNMLGTAIYVADGIDAVTTIIWYYLDGTINLVWQEHL